MDSNTTKRALLCGASLIGLSATLALPALAQDASTETVVVTGSRLQTNGFQAPTPVTVAPAEQLKDAAPTNLADGLNQLPVFSGSIKTQAPTTTNQPGATSGQNLLALRGLGANRTLVLLNGGRMPATNSAGAVDVDVLPQGLVSSVDIVTGGASAAYGSDAVSGVVNFKLNTHFEGLKGSLQGGNSTYNDLASQGGTITYGTAFLDEKLHIVSNFDFFHQDGLPALHKSGRSFFDNPVGRVPNPASPAVPASLFINDVRSSVGSYGGLITNGPATLKGMQFVAGGALAPFNFGTFTGAAYQSGGDGGQATIGLMPEQVRYNGYLRSEYDFDGNTTGFIEGLYSHSHTLQGAYVLQSSGSSNQYTIFSDNAYLPTAVKALMTTAKITSFTMGRFESDLPLVTNEDFVDVYHGSAGFKGKLFDTWTWDTSYTYGLSRQWLAENNLSINRNLYAAADAVVNPATNAIVCRSQYYNTAGTFVPGGTGLDAGCVPRNLFGPNQPDNPAADGYIAGVSLQVLKIEQQVLSANLAGDLGSLSLGAGPISVATGLEYRREGSRQISDPTSQDLTNYVGVRGVPAGLIGKLGGFRTNNPQPFAGNYNIKEGYLEVGIPILKDLPFAQSLNVDAAVRHAIYSTGAGGVTTWKVGVNYEINDEIRLRLTRSQDIRGADVIELFNPSSFISNTSVYPCSIAGCNGKSTPTTNIASGNPNLRPENAQTLTYGVIYRPQWLDGFQISVDYYNIGIKDAIGMLGTQQEEDQCAQGNQLLCSQISYNPATNVVTAKNQTLNLSIVKNAGIDFESEYATDLFGGAFKGRLLVNNRQEDYSQAPGSPVQQGLNSPGSPRWRANLQVNYAMDDWSVFLQERWQYHSKIDPTKILGTDLNYNRVPDIAYTDATITYKFEAFDTQDQVYFQVSNLLNQLPPVSSGAVSAFTQASNPAYDPIGRYFNLGLRFQLN